MGIYSFLDFSDFFITDGEKLKPFLSDAKVITDNRPILEYSPVTLVPPLKWQTDESFINLLRHRIDQQPPWTGLPPEASRSLLASYQTRTAQRFSVFALRYRGPGEKAFAARNYRAGMEAMRMFIEVNADRTISLRDARWGNLR